MWSEKKNMRAFLHAANVLAVTYKSLNTEVTERERERASSVEKAKQ